MNKIELVRDTGKSVQVFIDGQKQERVANLHMDFDAERRKMVLVVSQDSRIGVRKHNVYTDFTLAYGSEVVPPIPAGYELVNSLVATGVTYKQLLDMGWTDKSLIDAGHLVPVETIDDRMRQAWGADNTYSVKITDAIYDGPMPGVSNYGYGPEFAVSGESPSSEQDGPDSFDCPHAHAARTCGCGFCRALQVSEITRTLMEQLAARDTKGREKYGTTMDRKDLSLADWLQHQTEELLDGAGYAQAAKREAERLLLIEKAAHEIIVMLEGVSVGAAAKEALKKLHYSLLP